MKILKTLSVAVAVIMAISTLAGCGKNENAPTQGAAQSTTSESKPAPQSSVPQSAPINSSAPVSSSAPEQSVPTTTQPETSLSDGFPENPSEASLMYYEDATNLVDKYLCTVMSSTEELERLGLDDLDDENPEDMKKMVRYLIDCANNAEGYLDELERLTPTEEMSAFHGELVSLMNNLRGYTDIARSLENAEIFDEAASDEYNERTYRLFESFNREYKEFYIKYPGFGKTLAEGEWLKNTSLVLYCFYAPDLGDDAEKCAKNVSYALGFWLPTVNDKTPLANATLEIINTKNGCEITGAVLENKDIEELKQELYRFFPDDYEFWARVYLREDGSTRCTLYSPDGRLDDSELNGGEGLSENLRKWRDTGVTSEGHIIGFFGAPPTSEPQ